MRRLPILMYHWFRPARSTATGRSPQLEISPELFERQMRYLQRRGYRSVTLQQAVTGTPGLPGRPVVITFDDGTLDFLEHARPVLQWCGFSATLFVVSGYVGRSSEWDRGLGEPARPLMDWDQIGELQESGFEIGSHTHTHRVFTELSADEVRDELRRSRDELSHHLGTVPGFVAYPRGFYRAEHKRLAREAGYRGACAVILRWRDLLRSDAYELRRMTIKGTESMARFRLRLRLAGLVRHSPGGPGEA
jgi:peptidoglycan/xylan/chitin deacetylase (PgdA/CDA1 family)